MARCARVFIAPLLLVPLWWAHCGAAEVRGGEEVRLGTCRDSQTSEAPAQLPGGTCVTAGTSTELLAALKNSTVTEVWLRGSISVAEFPAGEPVTISRSVLLRGVSDHGDLAAVVGFEHLPRGSLVLKGAWLAMEALLVSGLWAFDDKLSSPHLVTTAGIQLEDEHDTEVATEDPLWLNSSRIRQLVNVPDELRLGGRFGDNTITRADGLGQADDSIRADEETRTSDGRRRTSRVAGVILNFCVFEVPQTPALAAVPDSALNKSDLSLSLHTAVKYRSLWRDGLQFNQGTGLNWPLPSIPLNNDHHSVYLLQSALRYLRLADTVVRPGAEVTRRMLLPGVPAENMAQQRLQEEASSECQTFTGWEYTGEVDRSLSGRTCVPWSDFSIEGLDTANLTGNSCRNPSYDIQGVWCFVKVGPLDLGAVGGVTWEFCGVPVCDGHRSACTPQHEGELTWVKKVGPSVMPWNFVYNGTLDTSADGDKCLPWNSADLRLFYHTVGRYGENDQCRLLDENSSEAPGCYIKDDTGQLAFAECAPIPGCPYDVLDMLDRRRSHMDIVPVMRESPSEAPSTPSLPLIAGASAAASVVVVLILYGAYRVFAPRGSAAGSKAEALKEIQVNVDNYKSLSSRAPSSAILSTPISDKDTGEVYDAGRHADWRETIQASPEALGLIKCHSMLGRGFTSTVWHATWRGSEVAAKAISLQHLPPELREVMFRGVELNVLGELNHPHITHIYRVYCVVDDVGDASLPGDAASPDDILADCCLPKEVKQVWIVMEMLHHGSLRKLPEDYTLGCDSPMALARCARVLLQLSSALQYLHESGIVHGDIKRENVLLQPDAQRPGEFLIKMTDFGVSHQLRGAQAYEASAVFGDIVYMAPEAFHRRIISPKMDIYSVGILMYELLAGDDLTNPRSANHPRVRELLFRWRPAVPDHVPACFREIIHRCWDEDASLRPTAAELTSQLLEAAASAVGSAEAEAQAATLASRPRKEPVWSTNAGGYAAMSTVFAGQGAAPQDVAPGAQNDVSTTADADAGCYAALRNVSGQALQMLGSGAVRGAAVLS
eukprot:jgi/Tetstr1/430176/TSEL_020007.t1